MCCLELIKFDVSSTSNSYCVELEDGALFRHVMRSWKMILGGLGKVLEILITEKGWEPCI